MELKANNIDSLYKKALKKILNEGIDVTARGLNFKECRFQHLILTNPRARIVLNEERNLNRRFMIGEFIWIMSGQCNLEMISHYAKNYAQFSDDGISLHGAYGPRLRHWSLQHGDVDQLENCLQRLKDDIYTRQAAIVILDPAIDFTVKTKDVPCNNYLQFLYREGKLDLMCYVRSNDMLLGFPYDCFEWTMLQEVFAKELNVELGQYHHMIGSMHIYQKDIDKMRAIIKCPVKSVSMAEMPEGTSIKYFDILKEVEKNCRETGEIDTSKGIYGDLPIWWKELVQWLKK